MRTHVQVVKVTEEQTNEQGKVVNVAVPIGEVSVEIPDTLAEAVELEGGDESAVLKDYIRQRITDAGNNYRVAWKSAQATAELSGPAKLAKAAKAYEKGLIGKDAYEQAIREALNA